MAGNGGHWNRNWLEIGLSGFCYSPIFITLKQFEGLIQADSKKVFPVINGKLFCNQETKEVEGTIRSQTSCDLLQQPF